MCQTRVDLGLSNTDRKIPLCLQGCLAVLLVLVDLLMGSRIRAGVGTDVDARHAQRPKLQVSRISTHA